VGVLHEGDAAQGAPCGRSRGAGGQTPAAVLVLEQREVGRDLAIEIVVRAATKDVEQSKNESSHPCHP
jgi:hypothetical protein